MRSTANEATAVPVAPAAKRYDVRRYALDDFDKHFCLRPPVLLVACLLFLARDFVLPLGAAATRLSGGAVDLSMVLEYRQAYWFLLQAPVLLVVYAWVRRTPGGPALARWAWTNGLWLLIVTVGAQLVAELVRAHEQVSDPGSTGAGTWLLLAGLLACGAYLVFSRRTRNALSDFPENEPAR